MKDGHERRKKKRGNGRRAEKDETGDRRKKEGGDLEKEGRKLKM